MADSTKYGMGQLRYTDSPLTPINVTSSGLAVAISTDTTADADKYQDILIKLDDGQFTTGIPYLLHLEVPQDVNYDCIYQLKLINFTGSTVSDSTTANSIRPIDVANTNYQLIKYIAVDKSNQSSGGTSRVIIYPVNANNEEELWVEGAYKTKVAIAKSLNDKSLTENDVVYDNEKYYIYNGVKILSKDGKTWIPTLESSPVIQNKNDSIMQHIWYTDKTIETGTYSFDIIFTPRTANQYNAIWLQMQRSNYDYDIYSGGWYGRRLDPTSVKAKLSILNNLIGQIPDVTKLNHIGVYGHPNLMLAINGQEIKIGQTGYYELSDFDITYLGVAAKDATDKYTIDYQYKKES